MAEQITFCSLNCQGLGGKDKRKDVLNFLKQKQYSIYCLQDTHFTEKEEKYIRTQWEFETYFNSYNSQSRGVAIFMNNNFEYKLNRIKKDQLGNKLILDLTINRDKRITLINLYGPNRDTPSFYDQIRQDLADFNNELNIITGDFNLIMDPEVDCKNYSTINNPKAREKVLDICTEYNLIDIWREFNMEKRQYTWRTKNGNKHACLDFFLISELLFTEIEETEITPGYRSDHSIISLKTKGSKQEKSKSFWKFNNSVLKDKEYVTLVKKGN